MVDMKIKIHMRMASLQNYFYFFPLTLVKFMIVHDYSQ